MLNIAPLHVRPTLLTYARAAKAQARASRFRPLVRAHGLLFAIMGYILARTYFEFGALLFVDGLLELLEFSPARFLTVSVRFALSPSLRQPYTVTLADSQFLLSRAGTPSIVPWRHVRTAVETDQLFVLVIPSALPVAIPKDQLASVEVSDSLRAFLSALIPVLDDRTPPSPLFGA
jgi:hypothetical protein